MTWDPLVIGIGSNIEPEHHIGGALQKLSAAGLDPKTSPVYRSAPVGLPEGASDFLNLAVRIHAWNGTLDQLIHLMGRIEIAHGRTRTPGQWNSRTLDLDLLVAGDECDPEQRLPHPDLLRFPHVAIPAADIIGSHRHPGRGRTYAEIAADVDGHTLALVPNLWREYA